MEAWAAPGKLGVIRELIRRHPRPATGGEASESGLPWEWDDGLEHEVSAALGISIIAAGKLMRLAWSLEARVPHVGQALDDGRLDGSQAKLIAQETDVLLDPGKLAAAERMILAGLPRCKTWADLLRLIQRSVCTVDPARRPLRPGGPDLRLQCRSAQPLLSPGQAAARMDCHPAPAGMASVDDALRTRLHARAMGVPSLTLPRG
jgi:hypothetical protein